jgi:hypothetical protein
MAKERRNHSPAFERRFMRVEASTSIEGVF